LRVLDDHGTPIWCTDRAPGQPQNEPYARFMHSGTDIDFGVRGTAKDLANLRTLVAAAYQREKVRCSVHDTHHHVLQYTSIYSDILPYTPIYSHILQYTPIYSRILQYHLQLQSFGRNKALLMHRDAIFPVADAAAILCHEAGRLALPPPPLRLCDLTTYTPIYSPHILAPCTHSNPSFCPAGTTRKARSNRTREGH
jgi:hypothetical protein